MKKLSNCLLKAFTVLMTASFVLSVGQCNLNTCVTCSLNGNNKQCQSCVNSLTESSTGSCVTTNLPANCLFGMKSGTNVACLYCNEGFKTISGSCQVHVINDCLFNNDANGTGECLICKNSKAPNATYAACETPSTIIADCVEYSKEKPSGTVSCNKCVTGKVFQKSTNTCVVNSTHTGC